MSPSTQATLQLIAKMIVSGLVVGVVSEIAKKLPTLGGLLVGAPVITTLSLFWLIVDRTPNPTIAEFCRGVFFGLFPTGIFVLVVGTLLWRESNIVVALAAGYGAFVVAWLVTRAVTA